MAATTEAPLSFERTVDPHVVWSLAPEQTFVTDWTFEREREEFRIAARLPLAHLRFSDTANPYVDVAMLAQLASQAGVIVVAELLDVPLDSTFLLRRVAVTLDPLEHNRLGRDATRFTLTTDRDGTWFKSRRTGRPPTGSMVAQCSLEGRASGTLEIQGVWVGDEMFSLFRRAGGAPEDNGPVALAEPEQQTGRALPRNQAITRLEAAEPGVYTTTILVDEDDPTYFARPLDHVPGMLMLEAAKQALTAAVCRERGVDPSRVVVDSVDFTFTRFAELFPPVRCALRPSGTAADVECTQGGRSVCKAKLKATVLDG